MSWLGATKLRASLITRCLSIEQHGFLHAKIATRMFSLASHEGLQKLDGHYTFPFRNSTSFNIPHIFATKLEDCQQIDHLAAVNNSLKGPGIALVSLSFPDSNSDYLRNLVLGLGRYHDHGPPIEHSATRGWFWDVRPKKQTVHQARSESSLNFPWHTDCSYESSPPQFFGLHVLHADRNGGGTLSALKASQVVQKLQPSSRESLFQKEFHINVPPEFFKGISKIEGSVLSRAKDDQGVHIRFRSDILQPLSKNARSALTDLNEVLESSTTAAIEDIRIDLTPDVIPDNTIILMDNSRWLHARTEVKDPQRHLRRIRWGRRSFAT